MNRPEGEEEQAKTEDQNLREGEPAGAEVPPAEGGEKTE
jgi:hypothetical protein